MECKNRIEAAWNGSATDHIPLTTWCFGVESPKGLSWRRDGEIVRRWYSGRMEFLHEIPGGWSADDEIARYRAWQRLGVDDLLDVSVPWKLDPGLAFDDSLDEDSGVMSRTYHTSAGPLVHSVRRSGEAIHDGWVTQPAEVRLIEDFNIPRSVKPLVKTIEDVRKLSHVFAPPALPEREWFESRMSFFDSEPEASVQAWTGFGIDAAIWFCGVEGALFLALDHPDVFQSLLDTIGEVDLARTELAASHPGTDICAMRGWYSSTDFWSPQLFRQFFKPAISRLSECVHRQGKKFAYVMTTGVDVLGPDLLEAGVDVLYFVDPSDPISGGLDLGSLRDLTRNGMTLVGGISTLAVNRNDADEIDGFVKSAIDALGPSNRFILSPVDALFPDTPWNGIELLIDSWKRFRE